LQWTWFFDSTNENRSRATVVSLGVLMPALTHVRDSLTELVVRSNIYSLSALLKAQTQHSCAFTGRQKHSLGVIT
jgi:hypothetical protein